jgi:SsrA-binding protein
MGKLVSQNRKAHHQFFVEDSFEAGVILTGTEVKSIRENGIVINDAFVSNIMGCLTLLNSHIPKYAKATRDNHEETRYRKLLLHRRETNKIIGTIKKSGYTMVPLKAYFNDRNIFKLEIGRERKRNY